MALSNSIRVHYIIVDILSDFCIEAKSLHPKPTVNQQDIATVNVDENLEENIANHEDHLVNCSHNASTPAPLTTNQTFSQTPSSSSINISPAIPPQDCEDESQLLNAEQPQQSHISNDIQNNDQQKKTDPKLDTDNCHPFEKEESKLQTSTDDGDNINDDASQLPKSDALNNQSLNMSDLSLNDSFITAALDGSSLDGNDNSKKPEHNLLSCTISSARYVYFSLPCNYGCTLHNC